MRGLLLISAVALTLVACGPKGEAPASQGGKTASSAKSARALPTGPVLSGIGTVISLSGAQMVLDHDAVAGGLAAGRNAFQVDAAVLAEAPIAPGARVAFSYQDWAPAPLLTELKSR